MNNECKTWDYLVEIGNKHGRYCSYASVCNGVCYFVDEILHPKKTAINPNEGLNRFYARLKKTVKYRNQIK